MKIVALAALAFTLMAGVAANAQPQNGHHNGPPGNPAGHPGGPGGPGGNVHPGPAMNNHPGPAMNNHPAPVMAMRGHPGNGGHGHHLPPGIRAPGAHHRAPVWSGHSWARGEFFAFSGFNGPSIRNWNDYGLPPAHPGAHWIYVDGWYLMVGNRTGRIIDEVPADY